MDKCLLCLELRKSTPIIEVTSKIWQEENIEKLIAKHLWPGILEETLTTNSWICGTCWNDLNEFHQFYNRIEDVHIYSRSTIKVETLESQGDLVAINNDSLLHIKNEPGEIDPGMGEEQTFLVKEEVYDYEEEQAMICDENNETSDEEQDEKTNHIESETNMEEQRTKTTALYLSTEELLAEHFNMKCAVCEISLETFQKLCEHFRESHNETGYAICCNKKFYKRYILANHLHRRHLKTSRFKCKICAKIMANRFSLERHAKMHTKLTPDEKMHKCEICGKGFSRRQILMDHKIIHLSENEKEFECEQCGKLFGSTFHLTKHINDVHMNKYAKECEICGKRIRRKDAFDRHMRKHRGEAMPTFTCDICGLKMTNKQCLKKHKDNMHPENGKRVHKCPICFKISNTMMAHKSHIRYTHELSYDFKCDLCDKAFKTSSKLKLHLVTHTEKRVYTCQYCQKTYNSNSSLSRHRRDTHSKELKEEQKAKYIGYIPIN